MNWVTSFSHTQEEISMIQKKAGKMPGN